ncbi:multiple sugar transport system substrate-binding protein [Nonomuraea thailandensis]|uniref:Multiple sugar transport system substrate-binding protein n=1 Tax=Nonomuraea thailandensis TaxID=1188745 RepID=A0A9X2K7K3_9ACTN|nr:sugar ABC transporter substrate-binding protein [Nonomuraea thailandensis]MCP2363742.1 multiple sugar transport system substrate-binding protein [Nonomuraea thailandensis]
MRRHAPIAAVVLTAVLAGCGSGGGSGDGRTEITFWDTNAGPARTPVWQHAIAEFEKANPTIKVNYVGIPITQAPQKLDTAIAGGGTPDVADISTSGLGSLVAQKALEPVDERIARNPALNGKFNEALLTTVKNVVPDGKMYIYPISTNAGAFWYREDWFKEAGVEAPKTWSEFFTVVDKFTKPEENRFGFTIRGGAGSVAQMLEVVYGQSGVTEIFDPSGKATLNDPRNVTALEKYAGLYKKNTPEGDLQNDYVKMVAQFDTAGSVAIMQHNLGSYQDHMKALGEEKVASFSVPKSDSGPQTVLSNPVGGVAVFSAGEHKEEAAKLAEFFASKEMGGYLAEKSGVIPANTDVPPSKAAHILEVQRVLNDPATKVVQMPYHLPEFNQITKTWAEPQFQKVLLGRLTAKAFLDELAGKLTQAQAEYKKRNG